MVDPTPGKPAPPKHEQTDVQMKPIVWLTVILAVASVIAFVGMIGMFDFLEERQAAVDILPSPLAEPNPLPPLPRLQPAPGIDLEQYRMRSSQMLESYQWIDRDGQVVRIPIERAMQLLLERGLPEVQAPPQRPDAR